MLIILEVSIQYQVVLLIFKKKRRDLVVSSYNFSLCGWSTDSDVTNCYNHNIKYPLGVQCAHVDGRIHRYGCGVCGTVFCNFSQVEGAPFGTEQQFFYNAYHCPNMWVWYGSNSQYNFTQES